MVMMTRRFSAEWLRAVFLMKFTPAFPRGLRSASATREPAKIGGSGPAPSRSQHVPGAIRGALGLAGQTGRVCGDDGFKVNLRYQGQVGDGELVVDVGAAVGGENDVPVARASGTAPRGEDRKQQKDLR